MLNLSVFFCIKYFLMYARCIREREMKIEHVCVREREKEREIEWILLERESERERREKGERKERMWQ